MSRVNFPVSSLTKSSNDPRELYLGLLYPTEDYKVYPFLLKDPDIKQLYLVHAYYDRRVSLKILNKNRLRLIAPRH